MANWARFAGQPALDWPAEIPRQFARWEKIVSPVPGREWVLEHRRREWRIGERIEGGTDADVFYTFGQRWMHDYLMYQWLTGALLSFAQVKTAEARKAELRAGQRERQRRERREQRPQSGS